MRNIRVLFMIVFWMVLSTNVSAQENPLEGLSYYIGTWGFPKNDPFVQKRPELKDLKIIDFAWGADNKVIHSKTGIYTEGGKKMFSEGIITYNPTTNKLVWLEFQLDGPFLFEGEYVLMGNNKVQRIYTVHYPKGYKQIPHPEVSGWTRLYRETFIPTSENSIDWVTETYIEGKWKPGMSGGDTKAVRD